MAALVGRLGSTLAKGRVYKAGEWVPGLPTLFWDSQGSGQGMGRWQVITTMLLYRGPHGATLKKKHRCGHGVAASSTSAPLSICPHIGLQGLYIRGERGKGPGFFPGEGRGAFS